MPGVRLDMGERWEIRRGLVGGRSLRAIAVVLGRPVSTVSREVDRNGGRGAYRARAAQAQAEERAKRPKVGRFAEDAELAAEVEVLLAARWSPQQVARRLRKDHPGDQRWVVSAQTIYRSLFVQGRGGLRAELRASLRGKRARRRPAQDGRGRLPGMVLISERPAEAEDRAVPGHWEGDLVIGKNGTSAVATPAAAAPAT